MLSLHRAIGVAVALFLLLLSTTGVLINHSAQLKLSEHYVNWPWLMQQYGIGAIEADASYLIDDKVISQFGTQLFVDATPVTHIQRPLLGGIVLEDIMVLATDDALILLSREGEFVERLGGEAGIPTELQNIGVYHGDPVLQAKNGMWRSNFLLDEWEAISLDGVSWNHPYPIPDTMIDELKAYFYGQGISVQQLLLDIHNGRILGDIGVWLIDVIAIFMVVLSFTGLWMWGWRRR
jgi:uncharacterized membrane protein (Fun14 family)